MKFKKIYLFLTIVLVLSFNTPTSFAQNTLQFTTYYPSPSGVYSKLRLAPTSNSDACDSSRLGTFFLDSSTSRVTFCRPDNTWGMMPGVWDWKGDNIFLNATGTALNNAFVGIGTSAPQAKLDITSTSLPLKVTRTSTAGNAGEFYGGSLLVSRADNAQANLRLYSAYNGVTSSILVFNSAQSGLFGFQQESPSNTWPFRIKTDAPTNSFYMNSSGYVGLGKSNPYSPLHVYQNDSASGTNAGLTIEQDGSGDAVAQFLLSPSTRWSMGIDNSSASPDNSFKIASSYNVGTNTVMTLSNTGRVGIGTTVLDATVSIDNQSIISEAGLKVTGNDLIASFQGTAPADVGTVNISTTLSNPSISFTPRNTTLPEFLSPTWSIGVEQATNNLHFANGLIGWSGVERVTLTNAGLLGIGTTSPTKTLDVNGDIRIRGGSPASGKILTATDSSGNTTWTAPASQLTTYTLSIGGSGTQTINCNAGDIVLSGGVRTGFSYQSVRYSYPYSVSGTTVGWRCQVADNGGGSDLHYCYVVCADL